MQDWSVLEILGRAWCPRMVWGGCLCGAAVCPRVDGLPGPSYSWIQDPIPIPDSTAGLLKCREGSPWLQLTRLVRSRKNRLAPVTRALRPGFQLKTFSSILNEPPLVGKVSPCPSHSRTFWIVSMCLSRRLVTFFKPRQAIYWG